VQLSINRLLDPHIAIFIANQLARLDELIAGYQKLLVIYLFRWKVMLKIMPHIFAQRAKVVVQAAYCFCKHLEVIITSDAVQWFRCVDLGAHKIIISRN
jgi:hypothetical protein